MSEDSNREEIVLQGVAASPGVSHGPAFVFLQKELEIPLYKLDENQKESEIKRFETALVQTRSQIAAIRNEVASKLGEEEAQIFDAHLLVLEDNALMEETVNEIQNAGYNIEYCFHSVSRRFIEAFDALDDEYIKERVTDIRDVAKRVLQNLMGQTGVGSIAFEGARVIVSEDLTPSDTAGLERERVLGFVTDAGSRTSHTVIMARSLAVPAVVGLHDVTQHAGSSDYILVDGYDGVVIINPTEETLFRYGQLKEERQSLQKIFETSIELPARSSDGVDVLLLANIGGIKDCEPAIKNGATGVGLFRTESMFLQRDVFPNEEEQFQAYRAVAQQMKHGVIIRTLDIGGDKQISAFYQEEDNPFMGFRAIRFCLKHVDIFKEQLRAILRASAFGKVALMYPMIGSVSEIEQANALLNEAKGELKKRKIEFDNDIEVGSMIEIPSAAMIADLLAEHCSFFSIGTNDLIQYLLAVDRVNDRIAHLYEPNHPAVIRTIARITAAAEKKQIKVGVCGEMAADPVYAPLLLGLGADSLSVAASSLPEIKYLIRRMNMQEARNMAAEVLSLTDPRKIFKTLEGFYLSQLQDVFNPKKR